MTIFQKAALVIMFITLQSGEFNFTMHGVKYKATVVVSEHNAPLGKFTLGQAIDLVGQLASSSYPFNVKARIGADDYALTVVPA